MTIPGVPESLDRSKVIEFFHSVGIDPAKCLSVELKADGIYAETFALDAEGRKVVLYDEVATHRIYIPFV